MGIEKVDRRCPVGSPPAANKALSVYGNNTCQAPLHRWVIQLSLLDQAELHQFQEFFRAMAGRAENFAFTDPWDGASYPSCSLGSDSMTAVLAGEWNGETSLTVLENGN